MTWAHFSPPIWGLIFAVAAAVMLWLLSLRLRDASIAVRSSGVSGVKSRMAWNA